VNKTLKIVLLLLIIASQSCSSRTSRISKEPCESCTADDATSLRRSALAPPQTIV